MSELWISLTTSVAGAAFILGSFIRKRRASLKTQVLFYVLEHSNFPAFSLPESCSQADRFPKNSLRFAFPSFVNVLILYFSTLRDVLFLQGCLQKYTFLVVSFRIERTMSLSRHTKVLKLISLCNRGLH